MPVTIKKLAGVATLVLGAWCLLPSTSLIFLEVQTAYARLSKQWQAYVDSAVHDASWHQWDCDIQAIVNAYNEHLQTTKGFSALDWRLIKALLWVESGAGSHEWNKRPMQIGVANDPGLGALLDGNEGGHLILPLDYKKALTKTSAKTDPIHNIRAGIAYLLMRMAYFGWENKAAKGSVVRDVEVKKGDSFYLLAKRYGSTVAHLKALNPEIKTLHPGQHVKVQAAQLHKTITGWRPLTTALMHARYNGFGDSNYAQKIEYVLPIIQQGTPAQCPSSDA